MPRCRRRGRRKSKLGEVRVVRMAGCFFRSVMNAPYQRWPPRPIGISASPRVPEFAVLRDRLLPQIFRRRRVSDKFRPPSRSERAADRPALPPEPRECSTAANTAAWHGRKHRAEKGPATPVTADECSGCRIVSGGAPVTAALHQAAQSSNALNPGCGHDQGRQHRPDGGPRPPWRRHRRKLRCRSSRHKNPVAAARPESLR